MATSIRPPSIARDVAELMKANRRVGGAVAASQVPVPAKDRLVIATNGQPASWQMSALPYVGDLGSSLNLSLNGLELDEATDYSVDYTTGIVTFSAGQQSLFKATPTPADVLTADYLTSDGLIAATGAADTGLIVADNFNRANSSSTINPRSDGGSWTLMDATATWGITGNKGYLVALGSGGTAVHIDGHEALLADTGSNAADVTVTLTKSNIDGSQIVLSWDQASKTGYSLFTDANTTSFTQVRRYGVSSYTLLGAPDNSNWAGGTKTIRVTHDGAGVFSVYYDGVLKGTYTDSSPLTAGTWVGIAEHNPNVSTWDDFSAVAL